MAAVLVPDALWNLIEPLLPPSPPRPNGGGRACRIAGGSEYCFGRMASPRRRRRPAAVNRGQGQSATLHDRRRRAEGFEL